MPQIRKKILSDKANLAANFANKVQAPNEIKLKAIVESLIMKGVNPNEKDQGNWSPSHLVAKSQNTTTLLWMLSLNTELSRRNMATFNF